MFFWESVANDRPLYFGKWCNNHVSWAMTGFHGWDPHTSHHKYCPLELMTTGRHEETLSALLALCEGNPSEHKWFPWQNLMRPSCLIDGFLCTEVSYAERAFMAVRSHVPCSSSLSSLSANFLRALPFAEVLFMRLVTCSTKGLLS